MRGACSVFWMSCGPWTVTGTGCWPPAKSGTRSTNTRYGDSQTRDMPVILTRSDNCHLYGNDAAADEWVFINSWLHEIFTAMLQRLVLNWNASPASKYSIKIWKQACVRKLPTRRCNVLVLLTYYNRKQVRLPFCSYIHRHPFDKVCPTITWVDENGNREWEWYKV